MSNIFPMRRRRALAVAVSSVALVGTAVATAPEAAATEQVNCMGAWDAVVVSWGMDGNNNLCYEGAGDTSFGPGLPQTQKVDAGKWAGEIVTTGPNGNWLYKFSPRQIIHLDGKEQILGLTLY